MDTTHVQERWKIEPIGVIMLEKTYKIQKLETEMMTLSDLSLPIKDIHYAALKRAQDEYLPWAEFRKKNWATQEPEYVWKMIRHSRTIQNRRVAIKDQQGSQYVFHAERWLEFQHEVDMEFGGNLLSMKDFSEGDKRQIIRRNLMEESIASSKLEGANSSRETARRMLTEGRKPRDRSERMIANNHAAMNWIEETGKKQKLSLGMLLDLHRMTTEGTLAESSQEGRIRDTLNSHGKRLVIKPWDQQTIAYVTPDREFVDEQLPRLIQFANDDDASPFIHPLIKAIMLHFWMGLLHPFEDGNGRLARILFYWYMLRKGYWAFSYLSLSERILKSPQQYAMSFIYSEQDNFDLNYFINYNVEKLKLARTQLQSYLRTKIEDNRQKLKLIVGGHGFNQRQIASLQSLHQGELSHLSVASHQGSNPDIGYITAVSDLKTLVDKGYLRKQKNGRNVIYLTTDKAQLLFK